MPVSSRFWSAAWDAYWSDVVLPNALAADAKLAMRKGGPPPHAKAHGCRAKHTYHYYPNVKVYFDISKEVYFYMKGQSWQVSASLPGGSHVQLGNYVAIQMDSDKPYTRFNDHKKTYPHDKCKNIKYEWAKKN